jgi:hypothetical protein
MTLKEFDTWAEAQADLIEQMIRDKQRPSIDRIDDAGHYQLDNVRIIPMAENSRLGCTSKKAKEACAIGEGCWSAKLNAETVRLIRQEHMEGNVTNKQLGAKYGVHAVTIGSIVRNKIWKHVVA